MKNPFVVSRTALKLAKRLPKLPGKWCSDLSDLPMEVAVRLFLVLQDFLDQIQSGSD